MRSAPDAIDTRSTLSSMAKSASSRSTTSDEIAAQGIADGPVGSLADIVRISRRRGLVRRVGFEPTCPFGQWILSPSRKPFRHRRALDYVPNV